MTLYNRSIMLAVIFIAAICIFLPACSSKGDAGDISKELADKLTDSFDFENGKIVDGEPPSGQSGDTAPQISANYGAEDFQIGDNFALEFESSFSDLDKINKAIIFIEESSKYIVVEGHFAEELLTLSGSIKDDPELKGVEFKIMFALQTENSITGDYITLNTEITDDDASPVSDESIMLSLKDNRGKPAGTTISGTPPSGSYGSDAPQITDMNVPETVEVNQPFTIELNTDFEADQCLIVMAVPNGNSYIEIPAAIDDNTVSFTGVFSEQNLAKLKSSFKANTVVNQAVFMLALKINKKTGIYRAWEVEVLQQQTISDGDTDQIDNDEPFVDGDTDDTDGDIIDVVDQEFDAVDGDITDGDNPQFASYGERCKYPQVDPITPEDMLLCENGLSCIGVYSDVACNSADACPPEFGTNVWCESNPSDKGSGFCGYSLCTEKCLRDDDCFANFGQKSCCKNYNDDTQDKMCFTDSYCNTGQNDCACECSWAGDSFEADGQWEHVVSNVDTAYTYEFLLHTDSLPVTPSLKITKTMGLIDDSDTGLKKELPSPCDSCEISFWTKVETCPIDGEINNFRAYGESGAGGKRNALLFDFAITDMKLGFWQDIIPPVFHEITTCIAAKWYHIQMHTDWEKRQFDVLLNGVLLDQKIPFANTDAMNLTELHLYHYSKPPAGGGKIVGYFDDLQLKSVCSPAP